VTSGLDSVERAIAQAFDGDAPARLPFGPSLEMEGKLYDQNNGISALYSVWNQMMSERAALFQARGKQRRDNAPSDALPKRTDSLQSTDANQQRMFTAAGISVGEGGNNNKAAGATISEDDQSADASEQPSETSSQTGTATPNTPTTTTIDVTDEPDPPSPAAKTIARSVSGLLRTASGSGSVGGDAQVGSVPKRLEVADESAGRHSKVIQNRMSLPSRSARALSALISCSALMRARTHTHTHTHTHAHAHAHTITGVAHEEDYRCHPICVRGQARAPAQPDARKPSLLWSTQPHGRRGANSLQSFYFCSLAHTP
jgi:hypothetical protein